MANVRIKSLTPACLSDYLHFFDTRAFTDNVDWSRCYCYFPHCDAPSREWHTRTAEENRISVAELINKGRQGYLAYINDEVVGWCNAGPCKSFPILADLIGSDFQSAYETTGAIVCFVVSPAHRGQGIAKELLSAACEGLTACGMHTVIAKPSKGATSTAENYPGPLAMYLAAGFTTLREDAEGNVIVRKSLP